MSWMRRHPARHIVVDVLGELFNEVYIKAATLQNAVSGFRCTGIVPVNSEILPIDQFLNDPRNTVPDLPTSSSPNFDFDESPNFENDDVPMQSASSDTPGTSGCQKPKSLSIPPSPNCNNDDVPTQSASSDTPGTSGYQKTLSTPRSLNYGNADIPTISASSDPPKQDSHQNCKSMLTPVSFSDIIPVPNIVEKVETKRSEESQIITGTPYKEKLLELSEKRGKKKACLKRKKPAVGGKAKQKKKTSTSQDYECVMCGEWWSKYSTGESWIQCTNCGIWLHEDCTMTPIGYDFMCDICI